MSLLNSSPQVPFPETEAEQIAELRDLLRVSQVIVGDADRVNTVKLPDALYKLLMRVLSDIVNGKPIQYVPGSYELTTQQGADLLGTSRQFFVNLLDGSQIPYHRVGTHRRVYLKDVMEYRRKRDQTRHEVVAEMAREAVENGMYD